MIDLTVSASESGQIRLFRLDTGTAEGTALRNALATEADEAAALAASALGVAEVDPWWLTLVNVAELGDLGLAGFLVEGHDVPRAQLDATQGALQAASGPLLLVHSPAFGGAAVTLAPGPMLSPLAQFDTRRTPTAQPMARAQAAPVDAEPPADTPAPAPGAPLRPGLVLALLAAAALLVLTLAFGLR